MHLYMIQEVVKDKYMVKFLKNIIKNMKITMKNMKKKVVLMLINILIHT